MMEIRELMGKKRQLAMDVANILNKFEEETGMDVSSLDFVRQSVSVLIDGVIENKTIYVVDPKKTL